MYFCLIGGLLFTKGEVFICLKSFFENTFNAFFSLLLLSFNLFFLRKSKERFNEAVLCCIFFFFSAISNESGLLYFGFINLLILM